MINFYPGPSKIYPQVKNYIIEGLDSGILSMNHRSSEFMELMADTVRLLKEKLRIPKDYQVVFTSSATECWEIIAQSIIRNRSSHVHNGAFGAKWMNYTIKLGNEVQSIQFALNELPEVEVEKGTEVICFTQNETSNGTQVPQHLIREARVQYPELLIALDATSSMAGIELDFELADIWFASVQKCFGLPAGMAVLICSPNAVERAQDINEVQHYNSLTFLLDNARRNQTAYTPNILDIFLLNRVLKARSTIDLVHERTIDRFNEMVRRINQSTALSFLVENEQVRSYTVLTIVPINCSALDVTEIARKDKIVLGSGYGPWKENTFRIANFPAIEDDDWQSLKDFFSKLE